MKHDTVIVKHREFGELVSQTFENSSQFKLFLQSIHGSLELKQDFSLFNGTDFIVHIPYDELRQSVIYTKCVVEDVTNPLSKYFKSRMEAEVIKES
jgi:hypothetical protein